MDRCWTALSLLAVIFPAVPLREFPRCRAAEAPTRPAPSLSGREAVPLPTLGGTQFWGDELFFDRWRIQRNTVSGHCRLLDGNNLRYASGTFRQCQAVLDKIKIDRDLPPMRGKAVLVLHGIADNRTMMNGLCRYLEEKGGYRVFNITYPSTRQSIGDHAQGLASVVDHLDGIEEINFVGYSLGNLVVRHYFADYLKKHDGRADPRFQRMVMIGPPNHGAELATKLGDSKLFTLAFGHSGQQLGQLWVWEETSLATPPLEFGIIAGGCGNSMGFNPLLPGDDDSIVTVASTRLAGASDFIIVPAIHPMLPRESRVHVLTLRFLQHGYFVAAERRKPIGKGEEKEGVGD